MAGKLPGRALDPNTAVTISGATVNGHLMPSANVTYDIGNSAMRWRDLWLSGTTINLGGATIKTDTDTGAIALIPKPTVATPNPVAMVVSPAGRISTVATTDGVPAANAVSEAAAANTNVDAATLEGNTVANILTSANTAANTLAAAAFSNAASRADSAYTNAVAYAASNTYVNNTFLPLAGGTVTGGITVSNTLSTGNTTINGFVNVSSNLTVTSVAAFGNDVTITGNLIVSGTRIFANTTTVDLSDNIITLNADIGAVAPSENAGLEVHRGSSANVSFVWNETIDKWTFTTDGTTFVTVASNNDVSTAYSNAISYSGNAALAYSNAIAYAASNTYVNSTFAPLSGATFTGAVSGITTLAAGNTTVTGFANVSSTLEVGGNATVSSSYLFVGQDIRANGQIRATGWYNTPSSSTNGLAVEIGVSTHGYILSYDRTGGAYGKMFFNANSFNLQTQGTQEGTYISNSSATHAFFAANGNVGIGNTSPIDKLVISDTNTIFVRPNFAGTTGIPAGVLIGSRNTANLTFAADSASGAAGQGVNISAYSGSQWYRGLTYNNKSGIPDLVLQQDGGNVGIGNTAPAERLVVNGLTRLEGNVIITSAATQCKIDFGNATQTAWTDLIIRTDTGTGEIFRGGSGYSSYTGTAGLNIFNSNGAAGHIGFFPGGTSSPVLLAAANGNVGVGTATPTTRFRVSGGRSVFAANSEQYSVAVQHNSGAVGQFYIGATNSAAPDMIISQTGGTEVLRIGHNSGLSLNTPVTYTNNFFINGYATMARMYSGADAVFGHNVYADPDSRVLKQVNSNYYASWIRMYYNKGIHFGTSNVVGTAGDIVSDPAGTTNDKMILDIDGRLMLNTTTANTTANTILTVKGFSSNTSAFMLEVRDSNNVLRSSITDRGAQNWYIMAGDGSEKGSIRYSTPGGFVGILYYDSAGASRSDFRHVANGGFTWHGHALSTVPPELMRLDTSGNLTIVGTLTESSSITLKENLDPIQDALGAITSLNGYVYDRKDGTAKRRAGLIAEEVESILPNVVKKDSDGNPTGIQYTNLIAYLVESIKELKAEIDILKSR